MKILDTRSLSRIGGGCSANCYPATKTPPYPHGPLYPGSDNWDPDHPMIALVKRSTATPDQR